MLYLLHLMTHQHKADKSKPIVFVVLVNGVENVKAFSFVFKFVIVAYVEDAVDDNK